MSNLKFPFLYWDCGNGHLCGNLLGTECSFLSPDLRKIRTQFKEWLQKEPEMIESTHSFLDPVLKMFKIQFRPSYQVEKNMFPLDRSVVLMVPAVYEKSPEAGKLCVLPLIDCQFIYSAEAELKTLVSHYSTRFFSSQTPEEVFRFLNFPEPRMEVISLGTSAPSGRWRRSSGMYSDHGLLQKVAERYPPMRGRTGAGGLRSIRVWERGSQVAQVELNLRKKRNVLLVGAPGTGKTEILRKAIWKISRPKAGELDEKEGTGGPVFWRSSPLLIISGAKYLGEWQEKMDQIITELSRMNGVLWVDQFMSLFSAGGSGTEDSLGAYILPQLLRNDFSMIGELTKREYDRALAVFPRFIDQFYVIRVPEMDRGTVFKVLEQFQRQAKKDTSIEISDAALDLSYRLLERFFRYDRFPGKAMDFWTDLLKNTRSEEKTQIDGPMVISSFTRKTGVPEVFLRDEQPLSETEVRSFLEGRIIGQEEALKSVTRVIQAFKAGLNDPGKPVSTMMFSGPTGVGKTATARALARFIFGSGRSLDPLIRVDMSELQHPAQIERLIGSRSGEPGRFIQEVREKPFSVILFDEIEKAHPAVYDALLAVLDEGLLIDALGRATDFRNAVIILTTNAGARNRDAIGFGADGSAVAARPDLRQFFRPEFLNRLDYQVFFSPLKMEDVFQITREELDEIQEREGVKERGIRLKFSEDLVQFLTRTGFDRRFGARPLQRTIEREVIALLSRFILVHPGLKNATVQIRMQNGQPVCVA